MFTPAGWKRFGLISTERDLDTWVIGDADNNGRLGIGTFLADRAGVNNDFRGALDVRGQIVADKLLMTGISTFQGTTIFEDVEIERLKTTGSLDVTGISTFSKQVIVGAGITANQLSVTGISTFTGNGNRILMQNTPGNSNNESLATTNGVGLQVDQINVVGVATFPSNITFTDVELDQIKVGAAATFSNINITNIAPHGGNLKVAGISTFIGNVFVNGNTNIGDNNGDRITVNALFETGLFPVSSNTKDLGSATRQWRDLHIDGTAHIDALDVDGTADFSGGVVANTLKVSDLANNEVVFISGNQGKLEGSSGLTFNGSTLALTGAQTISSTLTVSNSASIGADVTLSGELNMMGSTANKYLDVNIGTHAFHIRGTSGGDTSHILMMRALRAGQVELFYNGTQRLATTNTGVSVNGTTSATLFSGSGAQLTSLNASNITSGTIADARLPGTITSDITGTAEQANNINIDETNTDANFQVTFSNTNQIGYQRQYIDADNSHLLYQPNTNTLSGCKFSGNGSSLTNLNASAISSGTINDNRLPATITSDITGTSAQANNIKIDETNIPASFQVTFTNQNNTGYNRQNIDTDDSHFVYNPNSATLSGINIDCFANSVLRGNGSGITNLNGSAIASGTVPVARIGTGTKNTTTFYRGDGTFQQVVVAINQLGNAGDNRVITSNGGNTANAEGNLTFDGTNLAVAGNLNVNQVSGNHGQLIVGGAISCVGNITAFTSDIRLKTEIQPIENAVAKLLKLNGFTYEHNELAESLGYERNGERFSGVSAQDVKEVLPEAVKPAPANADYMTVQYEKLVPLLIEAIKELKAEIEELKK